MLKPVTVTDRQNMHPMLGDHKNVYIRRITPQTLQSNCRRIPSLVRIFGHFEAIGFYIKAVIGSTPFCFLLFA